jgi:hypothetical protein
VDATALLSLKERTMTSELDDLLPDASEFRKKLALAEAGEASRQARQRAEADAEKKALIDQFLKPSGVSDEEGVRRGVKIIERAVSNGLTEVQVHRFPNSLCTDHGRAINQGEPGWEETLTGVPRKFINCGTNTFDHAGTNFWSKSPIILEECPGTLS